MWHQTIVDDNSVIWYRGTQMCGSSRTTWVMYTHTSNIQFSMKMEKNGYLPFSDINIYLQPLSWSHLYSQAHPTPHWLVH